MPQPTRSAVAENRIAALAIAQFLLVEAVLESVSQFQDMTASKRSSCTPVSDAVARLDLAQLVEPYRTRFELFKQLRVAAKRV